MTQIDTFTLNSVGHSDGYSAYYVAAKRTEYDPTNINVSYDGREFSWGESIIDAGVIYRKDRFSLGIGGGINIDDPAYSYGSIGVGYNF